MKKILILLALLTGVTQLSKAQATIDKGEKAINLGIGLVAIGANAAVEYGIQRNIGIGAYFAYERINTGLIGAAVGVNYGYNQLNLGVRGAYHFSELLNLKDDKFDLYGAGGVGVAIENGYATDYDIVTGRYVYGTRIRPQLLLRVGSRYNFSPNMAGWAELGSGGSWIQAGISFKL